MRELVADLQRWLVAGEPVALATVIAASGPSPRPVGARMAVSAAGRMAGSVSGGCVEGAVLREAQGVLASGSPRRLRYGTVGDEQWEVGLACGGTVEIYVEPLAPLHRRLLAALEAGETVALVTRLDDAAHLLAWPDGRTEGETALTVEVAGLDWSGAPLAELRAWASNDLFVQLFTPQPTLTIVGAVHIAQPLTRLAQVLGFRVRVADSRRAFLTAERFPTADERVAARPERALRPEHLRPQDALVILTHSPRFDLPALEIALRSPVGYIGLLGSRNTQARRQAALIERGFSAAELARIHGPVGLDLGGREPEEIALAILAHIVAVRHGR